MITQTQKVLDYIDDFGSITPLQALTDLGVMRLAARIGELRNAGAEIVGEMVEDRNRYGEKVHYMKYRRA